MENCSSQNPLNSIIKAFQPNSAPSTSTARFVPKGKAKAINQGQQSNIETNIISNATHAPHVNDWTVQFNNFNQVPQADFNMFNQSWMNSQIMPPHNQWEKDFSLHTMDQSSSNELHNFERAFVPASHELEWQKEFETLQMQNTNLNEIPELDQFEESWKNAHNTFDALQNTMLDFGPYPFAENNPFLNLDSPLNKGLELFRAGDLKNASLAFEAAIQKNENISEAWFQLGLCQAENEKEELAIIALKQAINNDNTNLDALLALAISVTNEGWEREALQLLAQWLSTKYNIQTSLNNFDNIENSREKLINGFIRAIKHSVNDTDLQVGIGVLFYNALDYSKAADCFKTALQFRTNDHLLWNRLGATLANSGRSEEALEAYKKALSLRPSFARGRYNIAVACMNLGCYDEAVNQLISAISSHLPQTSFEHSKSLWNTLRRCLMMMNKYDLSELCSPSNNDQVSSLEKIKSSLGIK
ncbi:TPR-like protein [Rozella allomycis CSF55]|uniref:TPR-like protein n=1 Tax=Rozella allomycis (strain CSF55) TaxID=988480 RepID=A0A4V1IZG7_ROZAC|nr:TPR-like protein [Rozella allomycis CSF55]